MAASSSRKITLVSIDNVFFEVDESVALQSGTIKNMIEDVVDQNRFPLPNVDGKTLAKVVEYCKKHVESPTPSAEELKDLEAFDAELVKVDDNHFFDLLLAANYLDIKGLLDLTCEAVADAIKDLSVEDARKTFNIDNDFTPEEEAALRRENAWAFEQTSTTPLSILPSASSSSSSNSASSSSSKKITLLSSEKEPFEVSEIAARESITIRNMIEDVPDENKFLFPIVDGKVLAKVIEYCTKHVESPKPSDEDLKAFDAEFIKIDQSELFQLVLAANYLHIKGLLDLCCQTIADLIKDMFVEDVRTTFNLENDFTPEEGAAIRKENEWAFD